MVKRYSELIKFKTFNERFNYLKLTGKVGAETFGYDRYLNQMLYKSRRWRETRDRIIIRDNGFDLACEDYVIFGKTLIHHINPLTLQQIENMSSIIFDPENLITTCLDTHNAIHYGNELKEYVVVERSKNDTCPWRR